MRLTRNLILLNRSSLKQQHRTPQSNAGVKVGEATTNPGHGFHWSDR